MYRYKTKHKILSLLLVFSLLILTTVLVFPSPALAHDWVWWESLAPIELVPFMPPLCIPVDENLLDKLILEVVVPPNILGFIDVELWFGPGVTNLFTLVWSPTGWYLSEPNPFITVTDNPPGHIEVVFYPPELVTQVCFVTYPIQPVTIGLIQFVRSNQAPVADADGPYSGSAGSLITFNGSASYDPDDLYGDEIVSWEWEFTGDGKYDDASGEIVQWSWGSPYSGSIGLNVTDTLGAWDTDEAEVNVTPAPTPPPVTEVGGEVYPVDRLAILIPGLTLVAILIVGTAVVMRRRRARC